jgi:hypothetical protein
MLKTPPRSTHAGRDMATVRQQLADIREVADSAVQHAINRIELAFPDVLEHEKRRLVAIAVRPHREREAAAMRALVSELSDRQRRALFDETLDPRLLAS